MLKSLGERNWQLSSWLHGVASTPTNHCDVTMNHGLQ